MFNYKYSKFVVLVLCAAASLNASAAGVALGSQGAAEAIGEDSLAIGTSTKYQSVATGRGDVVVGVNAKTHSDSTESGAVALGQNANVYGMGGIAIGRQSVAGDEKSIAIGYDVSIAAPVTDEDGTITQAGAAYSVGIGNGVRVNSSNSVALGNGAQTNAEASVAFGQSAVIAEGATNSVALGASSSAGEANVVSVGNSALQRRLVNVAAGTQDNDAVNVAQLKELKTYTDEQLTAFQRVSQNNTVIGTGASIEITPDETDETGAVTNPGTYAQNAAVFGDNAKVLVNNGVAIGANSVASTAGRNAAVQFKPAEATGDAWQSEGLVSFGGSYEREVADANGVTPGAEGYISTKETVNFNRQLTGVAAGSEDNDAVNVAQLKQLEANTKSELSSLMTGETQVSKIQLTTDPTDENAPTIGLRYEVAKAEPAALADGDPVTPTTSQGRLVYDSLDAQGTVIGTETIATLNDGFFVKGGNTAADAAGVKVDLNKGISFLGDEYLQTTVTAGENGGAVVTVGASQTLKDFLNQSGVQPSDPTTPDNPGNSGNTGGSGWSPSQAQLAAMNGNFANGITVAPGEGNQAIQIKQGNVDMGGNRIQNVGNPINDGDAANKAYVDSTSRSLRNKINDVDKDLRAGVAMAMAVGGLPQAYMPGKSIFGVSAGTYHGQGGFALGLSHATDNRQWVFKGAASVDTRGNFGGQLSAGYQF